MLKFNGTLNGRGGRINPNVPLGVTGDAAASGTDAELIHNVI